MKDYQSLSHVKWVCKYHVVWVPKYRCKKLHGELRRRLGETLHELCQQKGIELLEGHAMPDRIHVCLNVPPKYSISHVIGFLKGKSAIRMHKEFSKAKSTGKHFWVRGYFVSTLGLDEKEVREYIRNQEQSDKRQMNLEFD